jgi:hypothetical protein
MIMCRSSLSPETQVLLKVADGHDRPAASLPIDTSFDWTKLLLLAQEEGAVALVWQWLRRLGFADRVPTDIAIQWQRLAMVTEFQMLHLERLLQGILDIFAAYGIECVLLKGSALAYTVYGSFAARPMGDLDLLVRPSQAQEAWALLQANGWVWPSDRWPSDHYVAHQHLPPLVHSSGSDLRVEIHTALLPGGHPFSWPVEDVWNEATHLLVQSRSVLVPEPFHQLLHLCIHYAWSHEMRWGSWRALRDVAAITRTDNIGWTEFVEAARNCRATTCCYWTLRLAHDLTGAAVPEDVLHALRPPRPESLLRRLECHYMLQLFALENACPSEGLNNALWQLGIAPRWCGHGGVRPWQGSEHWSEQQPAPAPLPRRVLNRLRHAAAILGYLGRVTAAMGRTAAA